MHNCEEKWRGPEQSWHRRCLHSDHWLVSCRRHIRPLNWPRRLEIYIWVVEFRDPCLRRFRGIQRSNLYFCYRQYQLQDPAGAVNWPARNICNHIVFLTHCQARPIRQKRCSNNCIVCFLRCWLFLFNLNNCCNLLHPSYHCTHGARAHSQDHLDRCSKAVHIRRHENLEWCDWRSCGIWLHLGSATRPLKKSAHPQLSNEVFGIQHSFCPWGHNSRKHAPHWFVLALS